MAVMSMNDGRLRRRKGRRRTTRDSKEKKSGVNKRGKWKKV